MCSVWSNSMILHHNKYRATIYACWLVSVQTRCIMTFYCLSRGIFFLNCKFPAQPSLQCVCPKAGHFSWFQHKTGEDVFFSYSTFQKPGLCNAAFETEILENIKEVVKRVVMLIKTKTWCVFSSTCVQRGQCLRKVFYKQPVTLRRNLRQAKRIQGFAIPTSFFHHMKRQKNGIKVKEIFQ